LADGKSVKSCVIYLIYLTKNKIWPGDGVIAERMNTITTGRKVNPIFGRSLASSRIIAVMID